MPITNKKLWNSYEEGNKDPYGKACVDVAREVMRLLDEDDIPLRPGYYPDINTPHGLICQADHNIKAGGITGFMAGCVAIMVSACHSRGEEFRKIHNKPYEEESGKEYSGVVNPAVVELKRNQ